MLIFINIVALLLAGWCFTRWLFLKKEIRSISSQLDVYLHSSTVKKVDISLLDKDLERLASKVNLLMDAISQEKAHKRRTEHELKQAVANISHDLRTPLTSVLGYLQLMKGSHLTIEENHEYLSIAMSRANRLKSLLNDFFDLSVIESVDYELLLEKVNINQLLMDVLLEFYDALTERKIEPTVNFPNEKLTLIANESAIRRVFENLISNAISYSKSYVSISLELTGDTVRLFIVNDVYEEVDIHLIFDRFYTADQTRTGRGTGLGLAISKSLMEKMKGSIIAEYENGEMRMSCEFVQGAIHDITPSHPA